MDVTQYIDLESYSFSPGFLGYTDHGKYSETAIESVCNDFLKKMAEHINDVTVVSSLFINSNKEELSQDYDIPFTDIDKFLHALLKNGLVKTIDLDTLPDPDSPLFDQEFRNLETTFSKLHSPDAQTLKDILQSFFHAVGLHGHIFLVFRAAELIVYPHTDDLGFGFISMNKEHNQELKEELSTWFALC